MGGDACLGNLAAWHWRHRCLFRARHLPQRTRSAASFRTLTRRPVVPGDQLRIYVTKERARGMVWRFNGVAKVDDLVVAEATYTAMIADK